MEFQIFNTSRLPDKKLLSDLQVQQVLCWWVEPFAEFHICTSCNRLNSIKDLDAEEDVKNNILKTYKCVCCWEQTKSFYQWSDFLQALQEYFSYETHVIIAREYSWEIQWYFALVRKTINELLSYELATRPNSYDHEKITEQIWRNDNPLLCMQHMYINPNYRGKSFFSTFMIDGIRDFWIPKDEKVILETHFWSQAYPLTRSLWFQNIATEKYGYVLQLHSSRDELAQNLRKVHSRVQFKQEQRDILSQNPSFLSEKFYT